jgi:hypothetical protein
MKKREIEAKEREKNAPKNPKKKKRENNKLSKNLNKQFVVTREHVILVVNTSGVP